MNMLSLHDRLVNWARYVRVTAKQGISPTGQFLERLKRNAGQDGYQDPERPAIVVDEIDGQRCEDAWRRCSQPTKDFLKCYYVWRENKSVVCRRLSIPFKPASIFDLRKHHAEKEIERQLESDACAAVGRKNVSRGGKGLTSVGDSPIFRRTT